MPILTILDIDMRIFVLQERHPFLRYHHVSENVQVPKAADRAISRAVSVFRIVITLDRKFVIQRGTILQSRRSLPLPRHI